VSVGAQRRTFIGTIPDPAAGFPAPRS
jgi:hypothetical protein